MNLKLDTAMAIPVPLLHSSLLVSNRIFCWLPVAVKFFQPPSCTSTAGCLSQSKFSSLQAAQALLAACRSRKFFSLQADTSTDYGNVEIMYLIIHALILTPQMGKSMC